MEKLECPNCHQQAISMWQKMCLGPGRAIPCPQCGSRLSVPYWAMLAVIPFAIGFIAAQLVGSAAVGVVLVVLGFLVMAWIHYQFVPLIVKK